MATQNSTREWTYEEVVRRFAPELAAIEQEIFSNLRSRNELLEAMAAYIARSGGKRLRPLLAVLCARLSGYEGRGHIALGNVVEFLHAATLLHDDVLDEAALRRGAPSANQVWGNHFAVLGGDYLYTMAFDILLRDFPREIIRVLCRASLDMIEGEVLQRQWRGRADLSEETYLRIVSLKTASLISATCASGAMLAGAPAAQVAGLAEFGRDLGIAFQIIDDTLDYLADPARLGKVIGGDLRQGTVTLPLIDLLGRPALGEEGARLREALGKGEVGDALVARIAQLQREHRCGEAALARARQFADAALARLRPLEGSPLQPALVAAAHHVINRDF